MIRMALRAICGLAILIGCQLAGAAANAGASAEAEEAPVPSC